MEELVVRILGVGDDGTLGVEAESHLIVLEAAVHGVDPGGAVGQHAGFPAGNSTACQVQPGDHGQRCHQCGNVQELLLQWLGGLLPCPGLDTAGAVGTEGCAIREGNSAKRAEILLFRGDFGLFHL